MSAKLARHFLCATRSLVFKSSIHFLLSLVNLTYFVELKFAKLKLAESCQAMTSFE